MPFIILMTLIFSNFFMGIYLGDSGDWHNILLMMILLVFNIERFFKNRRSK